MITVEQIDALVKGSKEVAGVLTGVTNELTAEAMNLFLVTSSLQILKFGGIFVLFFILKKYLSYLKETDVTTEPIHKGISLFLLVTSFAYFFVMSFPHLETIIKINVAPKIFLLQKGKELIEGLK